MNTFTSRSNSLKQSVTNIEFGLQGLLIHDTPDLVSFYLCKVRMFWKFPLREVVSCLVLDWKRFVAERHRVIWSVNNQAQLSAAYYNFSPQSEIPRNPGR